MGTKIFSNEVIISLLEKYRDIWALKHLVNLGGWDQWTQLPSGGVQARGEALGRMETLIQKMYLDRNFSRLVKKAQDEKGLNDFEKGVARVLARELHRYESLPPNFLEEFGSVTTQAVPVWKKAKAENNYPLFKPYLKKVVELELKKANYLGYEDHPYDALLDEFDEGLTLKRTQKYFDSILPRCIELLNWVKHSPRYRRKTVFLEKVLSPEKLKSINFQLLGLIGYDPAKIVVGESAHPTAYSISESDARIATNYSGKTVPESLASLIHEFGHALYSLQGDPRLSRTPIYESSSQVLHESQSLFWENSILKERGFIRKLWPIFSKNGLKTGRANLDDLYFCFNQVNPGPIRIHADEITYHLHIMIRFEIEKALLEGKIDYDNLPKIWNQKYKDYLGVEPKNNSEGVLQDPHWSDGEFGYLPTYSIADSVRAMWQSGISKDLGNFSETSGSKEGIMKIQEWLAGKVHRYGSVYTSMDLVKRSLKTEFSSNCLLNYLEKKYSEIY